MIICRNCQAEQLKGTLFCSECGTDLEVPAVPTFDLDEDEVDVPQLPPAPWQNSSSSSSNSNSNSNPAPTPPAAAPRPAPAYNPNYQPSKPGTTAPYGFPSDEKFDSILPTVPPTSRPPSYSPTAPTLPSPPPPGYGPNPGGYVMPPRPPRPPTPARSAIRDDLRMIVLNTGRVLECPDKETVIIGRFDAITGEKPDIDLTADNGVEMGVSRRHVCITFRDNAPHLTDLGSKNYTFLNRQQMMRGQPYPLQNGDEVRLGNVILKVLYDPDGLL